MARIEVQAHSASVVSGDWGPAIQAAVNALAAGKGGQLVFPTSDIEWRTGVFINMPLNCDIDFVWQGGMITVGGTTVANTNTPGVVIFQCGNVNRFSCNLKFLGHGEKNIEPTVAKTVDCLNLFALGAKRAVLDRCDIMAVLAAGAIVNSSANLSIIDCLIDGCGTTSATVGVVHLPADHQGLTVDRVSFIDFANYNGTGISKTNHPSASATNRIWTNKGYWIRVEQPGGSNGTGGREIAVLNSVFDEGAPGSLYADGGANWIDLLWRGNNSNVGNNLINTDGIPINARALKLNKVRGEIINSGATLANEADAVSLPWLEATNSNLTIRGRGKTTYVNRKVKDAATIIKET